MNSPQFLAVDHFFENCHLTPDQEHSIYSLVLIFFDKFINDYIESIPDTHCEILLKTFGYIMRLLATGTNDKEKLQSDIQLLFEKMLSCFDHYLNDIQICTFQSFLFSSFYYVISSLRTYFPAQECSRKFNQFFKILKPYPSLYLERARALYQIISSKILEDKEAFNIFHPTLISEIELLSNSNQHQCILAISPLIASLFSIATNNSITDIIEFLDCIPTSFDFLSKARLSSKFSFGFPAEFPFSLIIESCSHCQLPTAEAFFTLFHILCHFHANPDELEAFLNEQNEDNDNLDTFPFKRSIHLSKSSTKISLSNKTRSISGSQEFSKTQFYSRSRSSRATSTYQKSQPINSINSINLQTSFKTKMKKDTLWLIQFLTFVSELSKIRHSDLLDEKLFSNIYHFKEDFNILATLFHYFNNQQKFDLLKVLFMAFINYNSPSFIDIFYQIICSDDSSNLITASQEVLKALIAIQHDKDHFLSISQVFEFPKEKLLFIKNYSEEMKTEIIRKCQDFSKIFVNIIDSLYRICTQSPSQENEDSLTDAFLTLIDFCQSIEEPKLQRKYVIQLISLDQALDLKAEQAYVL